MFVVDKFQMSNKQIVCNFKLDIKSLPYDLLCFWEAIESIHVAAIKSEPGQILCGFG